MQPSISIDATHYRTAKPTGVEVYVDSLLPILVPLLEARGCEVVLLRHTQLPDSDPLSGNVVTLPYRKGWGQFSVASFLAKKKSALYFTPSGIPPIATTTPTAVTVHDISVYESPDSYRTTDKLRHMAVLKLAARKSKLVLVPSVYVADQCMKRWKLPKEQLAVTPLARQELVAHNPEPLEGVSEPFFLYVGRIEEKKQLRQVVAGFAQFATSNPLGSLVLVGGKGFGYERILEVLQRLSPEIQARIVLPGYVSESVLRWCYAHALALLVPSPYEGFGLPVLEGFAAEVPVLAVSAGAVAEVGGKATLVVENGTAANWASAMSEITHNSSLRITLVALGLQRLENYTWDATAHLTATHLLRVIEK